MEREIITHPTHSIDALLKVSQTLLNIKSSLPTDTCGIIENDFTKPVMREICEVSLYITSCLKEIYIKQ